MTRKPNSLKVYELDHIVTMENANDKFYFGYGVELVRSTLDYMTKKPIFLPTHRTPMRVVTKWMIAIIPVKRRECKRDKSCTPIIAKVSFYRGTHFQVSYTTLVTWATKKLRLGQSNFGISSTKFVSFTIREGSCNYL